LALVPEAPILADLAGRLVRLLALGRWISYKRLSFFTFHGVDTMRAFAVGLLAASMAVLGTRAAEPIELFNGKDMTGWYGYVKGRGKGVDPKGVFGVKDGHLRISGEEWGALTTEKEFSNYKLTLVYTWGGKVFPPREKTARDSGLILHATGTDGVYADSWMNGLQCNMIEGGTGDISILGKDPAYTFTSPCEERPASGKMGLYYKPGAPEKTFNPGARLLWPGKDPAWANTLGFRGKNDPELPVGKLNTIVCICKGDSVAITLNGTEMSAAKGLKTTKGKIQFQSEGAELLIKSMTVLPLD
jgi:hypothetical protein